MDIGKGAMERRKWEERRRYVGRVCRQPGLAPFPASLLGALRGRAVDGRSTFQQQPRGASSIHAVSSRVWVFGVRGGGGEGP